MRASTTRLILAGVLASATSAALAACSDDEPAARPGFDPVDSSTPEANLPTPSPDASDASEPRPPFDPADVPVTCAGQGPCATQIVAGQNYFCALMSDGTVRCWGENAYGALGNPPKGDEEKPVRVVGGIAGATQLSAARATTCARINDGSVMCWGSNSSGQLGLSESPQADEDSHPEPSPVALTEPATRVDIGERNVCAVLAGGKLSCWGDNQELQVARADVGEAYVLGPGLAAIAPTAVTAMGIGTATMIALTTGGELVSWGAMTGREGFLGGRLTSMSPTQTPYPITQLKGVTRVVAATTSFPDNSVPIGFGPLPPGPRRQHGHACAIAEGEVYCWGRSDTGALCTGMPGDQVLPTHAAVQGRAWPQRLALGDELTCARMTDGTIQCCGGESMGRLGDQEDKFAPAFRQITAFRGNAVSVAASQRAVCALVKDGTVDCWGSNSFGELGLAAPDEERHPTPVKVAF